jgi:hypothetical protein
VSYSIHEGGTAPHRPKEKTMMQSMNISQNNDNFIFTVEHQEHKATLTKEELLNVFVFVEQMEAVIMEKLIEELAKDDNEDYQDFTSQSVVVPHLPFTFSNDDMSMIGALISDVLAPPLDGDESNVEQIIRIAADAEKMFSHLDGE